MMPGREIPEGFPVGTRVRITGGQHAGQTGVVTSRVGGLFDAHYVQLEGGEKPLLPRVDLSDGMIKTLWERIADEDPV